MVEDKGGLIDFLRALRIVHFVSAPRFRFDRTVVLYRNILRFGYRSSFNMDICRHWIEVVSIQVARPIGGYREVRTLGRCTEYCKGNLQG